MSDYSLSQARSGFDIGKFWSFDGRIGRAEYWGIAVADIVLYLIGVALLAAGGAVPVILALVIFLVAIVVSLAASIKRWHDRDKSGWWIFIGLVPLIGGIWSLVEQGFLPGTPGPNQYGAPKSGSPFGG